MSSSFPSVALNSDQYIQLRGDADHPSKWRCRVAVSVAPNPTTVAARVNGTPAPLDGVIVQFNFDGVTAGAMSSVKADQTIFISRTNNIGAAYYIGRVRAVPSGSSTGTFNITECSYPIRDNDYFWVIEDYRLWPILARDVNGVQYKDYNEPFAQLPPMVVGVKFVYAGNVDPDTGKLRIAFNIGTSYPATSGSSIASISWSLSGVTIISGATNASAVTGDFPPSDGTWYSVTVTDTGGRSTTRRFLVFAHDGDHPPVATVDSINLTGELLNGWNGTMTSFDGAFVGVLDNSLVCIWIVEWLNEEQGAIYPGNNILFTGRIRHGKSQTGVQRPYGLVSDTSFDIEGVGAQLQRLHGALIAELNATAPAAFDQIKDLTVWRGVVHMLVFHSTYTSLHDLEFNDLSNTFLAQGLRTQGGNLLAAINDLGYSINAGIEFMPDGSSRVVRDLRYRTTDERDDALIAGEWTMADLISYTIDDDHVLTVGRVDASGGTYFLGGAIDQVNPAIAIAPGIAFEYAEGTAQLTRQILQANVAVSVAKSELAERGGRHFGVVNTRYRMEAVFVDNHHFLSPSLGHFYTFDLPAETNEQGIEITPDWRWLCNRVALGFNSATGEMGVSSSWISDIDEDTVAAAGDNIEYPSPETTPPVLAPLPPVSPYPGFPDLGVPTLPPPITTDPYNPNLLKRDGNTVVAWDVDYVWISFNFKSPSRTWKDITPPGTDDIRQCLFDPTPNAKGLWILRNDGTDSYVDYTADFTEGTVGYTSGARVGGIYTELRATNVSGGIMIYSVDIGSWSKDWDLTSSQFFFVVTGQVDDSDIVTVYTPGVGFVNNGSLNHFGYADCTLRGDFDLGLSILTKITWTAADNNYIQPDTNWNVTDDNGAGTMIDTSYPPGYSGNGTFSHDTSLTGDDLRLRLWANSPFAKVTYIKFEGLGVNPFGGGGSSGSSTVAYSSDNGDTWTTEVVGDSPGVTGGFDTQRAGGVSLAAATGQGHKATSLGGSYSSLGTDGATTGRQPRLLLLTWGQIGAASSNNITGSSPDYILGASGLVSGECLWFVDGGGGRHDITPSGVTSIPSNNCLTTYFGNKAALIAWVGSTKHLFTTTNLGTSPTWTDRGAVGDDADFIRPLRLSQTLQEFFYADGDDVKWTQSYGGSVATAQTPSTGTLLGVEVLG